MIRFHAVRLTNGQDVKQAIIKFVSERQIKAGVIGTALGSLSACNMRLAGAQPDHQPALTKEGSFEIVSLIGTVGAGAPHLHIAVSDEQGAVYGGHLKDGCIAKTTVELVIIEDDSLSFERKPDEATGFDELVVT